MADLYLGIDLGGTFVKLGVCTAQGEVKGTMSIPTRPDPMCRLHARVRPEGVQAGGHRGDRIGSGDVGTAVPTRGSAPVQESARRALNCLRTNQATATSPAATSTASKRWNQGFSSSMCSPSFIPTQARPRHQGKDPAKV